MYSRDISEVLCGKFLVGNDYEITEISVDSRLVTTPESTLFFAFKGINHNGHDFIPALYEQGVRNFVVSEMRSEYASLKDVNFYLVADMREALQKLAASYRSHLQTQIVGISGSNGKTIVKEWIYQILADEQGIYRSPRSYNSQIGVPLSVLGIKPSTRLALIEAGISMPGEMERLEYMIRPGIGIFTHLGDAHGENFLSRQQKLEEKAKLYSSCQMLVGRAGETLDFIISTIHHPVRRMAWGEGDNVELHIVADTILPQGRNVSVIWEGNSYDLHIPFSDEASLENAMNAVCFLLAWGMDMKHIIEGVAHLQPIAMRMEIKDGINNCVLINDYYNSDAASFKLALNALMMQDAGRKKVVILSDFVGVGAQDHELYSDVAMLLSKSGVDEFIGIGKKLNRYRNYFNLPSARFYEDTDAFLRQENRDTFKNQSILIKGARKYQFEYIAGFLQKQSHATVLEVDLDAMVCNLNHFRSLLPSHTMLAVMVKAFSYGCGSVEIANMLQYQGVNYLMVAFADEGVELRAAGITVPIAVMNPEQEAFDNMIEFNLEPEIYSLSLLESFDEALIRHGIEKYPVHLKLNTGMNRSGLDSKDLPALIDFFHTRRNVMIRSMFSHLAGSDEAIHDDYTHRQIDEFIQMTEFVQSHFDYHIIRHILNSAGIERFSEYAFDMARLGIGLHGISFAGSVLHSVSSFKTYIASIRNVPQSETVGYGRKGRLDRDSKIAVIPVGYADGMNRHLSCGVGEVWVCGKKVPVVGNICMDTCMIDVTDIPVQLGDEVEIFGKHIPVTEVAKKLDTIPYEVLTSISHRVKRVYFKE